MIWVCGAGVVS